MINMLLAIATVAVLLPHVLSQFRCPDNHGYYPDPDQCDLYYECRNGEPTTKLCKDGLVFNANNPLYERCDYPFAVKCKDRTHLQPPTESKNCPRRNGLFARGQDRSCKTFWQCVDGLASRMNCQTGLAFNPASGTCQWKYLVPECNKQAPAASSSS